VADKKVDVTRKYSREIQDIKNKLQQLKDGRIYEFTSAKMDGYLFTNISQLEEMIDELIDKIGYCKKSTSEKLSEVFDEK